MEKPKMPKKEVLENPVRRHLLGLGVKAVVVAAVGVAGINKLDTLLSAGKSDAEYDDIDRQLEGQNNKDFEQEMRSEKAITQEELEGVVEKLSDNEKEKGARDKESVLSREEKKALILNVYHEATKKGDPNNLTNFLESRYYRLSIMLVTLERAFSRSHPASVRGVVYEKNAFSWTLEDDLHGTMKVGKSPKEKFNTKILAEIINLVEEVNKDASAHDVLNNVRSEIESHIGQKIEGRALFYKRADNKGVSKGSIKFFRERLVAIFDLGEHTFYMPKKKYT
jgi:Cell Wall Hydrolase